MIKQPEFMYHSLSLFISNVFSSSIKFSAYQQQIQHNLMIKLAQSFSCTRLCPSQCRILADKFIAQVTANATYSVPCYTTKKTGFASKIFYVIQRRKRTMNQRKKQDLNLQLSSSFAATLPNASEYSCNVYLIQVRPSLSVTMRSSAQTSKTW